MNKSMLLRVWQRLQLWYCSSLTCFCLQSIGGAIRDSWFFGLFRSALSQPPAYARSRLHDRLTRFNRWLGDKGERFSALLRESFLCRVYGAVFSAGRNSRIMGRLFRNGMTAILLFLIGGYVIWDYLLRDVLTVPVFSSLWDELLLMVCFMWIFYQRLSRRGRLPANDTPLDMPVLFFLSVCILLLVALFRYPDVNIAGLRVTTQYILWFFVVTSLIRDDRDFGQLYLMMVLIAAVIGLHGIYQYIVGAPIPEHWVDQAETSVRTRVYSIFSSCNIMGDFMVLFAPMAAGIAYAAPDKRVKAVAWGCTLVMCMSCLLTMSRGAWVSMVVAVLIFALLVDMRLIALMLILCVLAVFLPFVQSRIGYLFTDAFTASANKGGRAVRWETTIDYLFSTNPVLGMGFGIFGGAVAVQHPFRDWLEYFYTDNYYLKILAENGFVGLFGFIVMMLGVLWTGLKSWFFTRRSASRCAPLCAGMLSGLTGVLVHCYFENIFEEPYMMACFWIIAAMLMYVGFLRPAMKKEQ